MRRARLVVPLAAAALLAARTDARAAAAATPPAAPPAPAAKAAAAKPARAGSPRPAAGVPRAAARGTTPTTASREGLAALEERLNAAADRVSMPQLLPVLGRASSARSYRLPGFGVVVVLAPRILPGSGDVFKVLRAPRHRVRAEAQDPGGAVVFDDDGELDAIERQVILLQHESEQARRAAEETQQKIVETVRVRLGEVPAGSHEVTVEVAPAAPAAPPAHAEPPAVPSPPLAPAAPAPEVLVPPPPPPWTFWFHVEGPRDSRAPDAVVADVRGAIADALVTHPGPLAGLGPDEFVAVAVDFEDATRLAERPRPAKTLVVRARVRDLAARAAGTLAPEEARRKLEVLLY